MLRRLAAALLLLGLLLPLPHRSLQAQVELDTSRREALERQIEEYQQLLGARQQEEQELSEQLSQTSAELQETTAQRDRILGELAQLRNQQAQLQAQMEQLNEELRITEERIERILSDLEALKVRIEALLVNLHRQDTARFASVLTEVNSFFELQVKNRYLSLLGEQDTELMHSLEANRQELLEAQLLLSDQLSSLEATQAQLAQNEAQLAQSEAQLREVIAQLESTREGQMAQRQQVIAAQAQLESELGDLDRQLANEIQRLREEQARIERQLAQEFLAQRERERLEQQAQDVGQRIENLTGPIVESDSGYIYPLTNPTVLARYGVDNNSYMTLRAQDDNAPVLAVQDGVVRGVSFVSANDGYMVSIAHSDTLSSVYTNLRPPEVQVGDRVSQGQVIGYLGGSSLLPANTLKLWVQVNEGGRSSFVDPSTTLGL